MFRKRRRAERAKLERWAELRKRCQPPEDLSEEEIERMRTEGAPEGWSWRMLWEPTIADVTVAEFGDCLKGIRREK